MRQPGTGKTSTSLAVVNHFKPKKGFYTAFNKSIVTEADEKFPRNMNCVTKHAFARRILLDTKSLDFKNIEPFTYTCFSETLSYKSRKEIMSSMNAFFLSDSVDMEEYLEELLDDPTQVALAIKYIMEMVDSKRPPTFDFLLKYLHLQLFEGNIVVEYDLAILDECQDTTKVFFQIFMLIKCDRKLIVGDPFQNIYGYMNTVNAFNLITDVPVLKLTKTFRCSKLIADRVEKFGQKHLSKNFKYTGTDSEYSDATTAYIGRTNSSLLEKMLDLVEDGEQLCLTRKVKEIFALPIALANVSNGREVYHKQYKYLEKEYKNYTLSGMKTFYTYLLKHVEDEELHAAIKFMLKLSKKKFNIFSFKKDVEAVTVPTGGVWVVTAHSFKGREVDRVIILDSLNKSVNTILAKPYPEGREDQEELNLGYVGMTRARHELINCTFA